MQNKEALYGWLFTYNPYHDLWYACDRDHYLNLFTNRASEGVISSPDFETLKQLIIHQGSSSFAEQKAKQIAYNLCMNKLNQEDFIYRDNPEWPELKTKSIPDCPLTGC